MSIDVSFITINYNSTKYTLELINSIKKQTLNLSYEIIIVDNASKDKEYDLLLLTLKNTQDTLIIRNGINSGFASGNMLGEKYAKGKYYFFINNDTQLLNNSALIMKNYLDTHLNISLATATVNDENGNFSSSYKLFPSLTKELFGNKIARKFSQHNFPSNRVKLNKPTLVEVISGSCMFFRAPTFKEIGGFDTTFFLYCEEEDISKRVWDNNNEVVFLPDAEIYHASGGSTEKSFDIQKEYYISYKHLIFKHFNIFKSYSLMFLQLIKLFRRSFKRKNGVKLFIFGLSGFSANESLRYSQKKVTDAK